jgi:hypothetical protein
LPGQTDHLSVEEDRVILNRCEPQPLLNLNEGLLEVGDELWDLLEQRV